MGLEKAKQRETFCFVPLGKQTNEPKWGINHNFEYNLDVGPSINIQKENFLPASGFYKNCFIEIIREIKRRNYLDTEFKIIFYIF